jgi:hypothetical protein
MTFNEEAAKKFEVANKWAEENQELFEADPVIVFFEFDNKGGPGYPLQKQMYRADDGTMTRPVVVRKGADKNYAMHHALKLIGERERALHAM